MCFRYFFRLFHNPHATRPSKEEIERIRATGAIVRILEDKIMEELGIKRWEINDVIPYYKISLLADKIYDEGLKNNHKE